MTTQMRFRAPIRVLIWGVVVIAMPWVALFLLLASEYPSLRTVETLELFGLRVLPAGVLALSAMLIRVPVRVDAEGIWFAWIFHTKWSDVTDARIRLCLGFRVLEISRRRGLTWRAVLSMYVGLPEFLARHAPDGNPLRLVRGQR